ncbi:MAG: alpha/beta hydrolase [Anaerolineales bacterium]|nr:alpha/beta hydrolase [Anaerolineales bacterium]
MSSNTHFISSPDGTQIAYRVTGSGAPLILLHGGGQSKQDWVNAGYVARLSGDFQVITIDLRGNGESGMPDHEGAYVIKRLLEDVLAVADACGVDQFALWGFSYGANVGRYLASRSERVTRFVMGGIPFGSATPGTWGRSIRETVEKWAPILSAQREGTLDLASLSEEDRENLAEIHLPRWIAVFQGMVTWPDVAPTDLRCPTLLLVGSEGEAYQNLIMDEMDAIKAAGVQVQVFDGLTHLDEFSEIDLVLPLVQEFLK